MGEFSPVHWLILLGIILLFLLPLWPVLLIARRLRQIADAIDRTNDTVSRVGFNTHQAIKDSATILAIGDSSKHPR